MGRANSRRGGAREGVEMGAGKRECRRGKQVIACVTEEPHPLGQISAGLGVDTKAEQDRSHLTPIGDRGDHPTASASLAVENGDRDSDPGLHPAMLPSAQ